jgi:2Fe-2S ferredoxin
MVKLTFIDPDGEKHEVESEDGDTLMDLAVNNDVPGLDADCGGACACATCHIILDLELFSSLKGADEEENDLLDFIDNKTDLSRLSCQIDVVPFMEGVIIKIPKV